MLKNRIMIGAAAAAAAIVPIAGVSALAASPAGAATPKGITCTKLTGSANTSTGVDKTKVTGCTPTTKTGGTGKSKGMITDTTVTTKWANGKSTSYTQSASAGSGCTQANALTEVRPAPSLLTPPEAPPLGRLSDATVCVVPSATNPAVFKISLLPGTKFKIDGV